jgi:hypothetical protein
MLSPSFRTSQQLQPSEHESGLSTEQPGTMHSWMMIVSQYVASLPTQSSLDVHGSPCPTAALLQVDGDDVVSQAKPCGQSASAVHVVVQ